MNRQKRWNERALQFYLSPVAGYGSQMTWIFELQTPHHERIHSCPSEVESATPGHPAVEQWDEVNGIVTARHHEMIPDLWSFREVVAEAEQTVYSVHYARHLVAFKEQLRHFFKDNRTFFLYINKQQIQISNIVIYWQIAITIWLTCNYIKNSIKLF